MTSVVKTVRFDAAHVLTNHKGLCKNLHGHTYRVDVEVAGGEADGSDMVIDFKDLKQCAEQIICSRFDHTFICNQTSPGEMQIAAVIEAQGMRVCYLPFRSTAENLAMLFFKELQPLIPGLAAVRVWETADSCAQYHP